MSNLYSLSKDIEELYSVLVSSADDETGEIDEKIAKALTVKEEEFREKAISVATVSRRFDNTIDDIDAEIDRLTAIKKRAVNIREKLKKALSEACERTGIDKIDGISARISFIKSEKTIVENESELPEEFFNVTITKKPNLKKIKERLNAGEEVPGARIEKRNNIQIK